MISSTPSCPPYVYIVASKLETFVKRLVCHLTLVHSNELTSPSVVGVINHGKKVHVCYVYIHLYGGSLVL